MEKEEGQLPFLDIAIYRKTDGSIGHKVHRKPTHTNLYPHQNSHRHPANKQSVLASLIHRAKALCDQDSLTHELEFLTIVFKDNGYSHQQIRVMKQATRTAKTDVKLISTAYIPYTQQHMADSAECSPNTTSKVSPYHLEKYSPIFHQARKHWD
jgi:hypothetical protein